MKISFNPSNSNKNILDLIKNNKDIIFDLKGHSIFARGVEFKGTDTNTWRDIKINNVSIGSHTLDLRNGSNTTLTNTNGVVTINSTWRPVVDNLTSDSTTSSLSAKQGKVLKALIDGKSDSDHNHDGRYVKKSGDTMQGVLTIDTTNFGALTIKGNDDANGASIQFRGKSSVYGYIGLNNSTKDKQFLRWSSDTSRIYTILDTSSTYISNGKGVINGTTITQVDNATNSTNSTNARKLVNWYSARPTSLNAQFGDGSLRIFYATSSTTEGKPAEDSHILHLAWDNTGGFDAQLAVHARSGKVSTRAQNDGTWQPWKTLAFTTDIPSSLKNPYSFNVFGVVYDGSAAKTVTTSNFISQVNEGTSTITDGTMLITSYATNSGFADTNAVNVPYKRKAIHLWEYIKTKTDSLYATKGHNHDASFVKMKQFRFNQYKEGFWTKILTITINSTSDLQPVIAFNWIPSECAREVWAEFTINWRSNSPIFYAIWKGTAVRTLTCVNSSGNIWNVWVQGDKNSYDPFGEVQVTYAHNISSYNGGSLGYSDSDPGGTRCTLGGYVNYARSTGNADTVDGQHASAFSYKSWWHWYGKDGQPNWLWGGNNENDYYVYNPSNFRVAYAASAGNADTLDGYPANGSNDRPYGHIPTIESDGVMEVGKYIDFHNDNNGKHDFSTRLQSTGNYGNEVNLPSASGTLALINDVNNYYWANVKISTSSSTTTSPTVLNLTATNSIRMGNILLEHTNEINNSANDSIHLNLRNSGNVSLCVGGGKVGIGTMYPSQELYVLGYTHTKGFGIGIQYLSESGLLPTISPGDGYTYRCLEIGRPTKVSCIIADKVPLSGVRGILIKFMQGFDGQIVLLKDLENYGSGNGCFWVMPSGCKIINADNSNILINQNQISNIYDDSRSRFFIYSSKYGVWIEFFCSNIY